MAVSPVCIDLAWSPPDSPAAPLRNEPLAGADSASESKTVMDLTSAVRVARPLAAVGRPEAVRIQPARPSVSVAALLDSSSESDDGVLLAAAAAAGCNVDDADFGGYASSDGDDGSSDQSDRSAARGVKRARDAELDELAPPAKLSKDELKARAKAERTAKKEREKEAKRVERERKKREREAAKAAAKSAAAAERRKESQRRGGFKLQEIEVVLGSAVATTDAGAHIASAVRDLGFATCALPETTCSVVDNAVRWRRRAWLPGREGEAVDARFSAQNHWFPLAARWVEGSTLVRWLERGGADGSREVCAEADRSRRVMAAATRPSAAALAPDPREVRARSASDGGRGASSSSSSSSGSGGSAGVDVPAAPRQRFLLLVQGAQGAVARGLVSSYESSQSASQSQSQSQTQSQSQSGRRAALVASSTTKEDLVTAEAAMYVEHSVESVFVLDVERCAAHVAGLTKALAELPFKAPASRLSCVRKLKARASLLPVDEGDDGSEAESADEGASQGRGGGGSGAPLAVMRGPGWARNVWLRQLMTIPRVSEAKARAVLRVYPTIQHLLDVYDDAFKTEEEKQGLLATVMSNGKRSELALSARIYTIFTSGDPNEIV